MTGQPAPPARTAGSRDPRLDFFRGLSMFIIFVAHVPYNPWASWIPARFGISDATEIFVFCSGMASAYAFGRIFRTRGWFVGTARVLYRAWQVYWVHVAFFAALAASLAALDAWGAVGNDYVSGLNLVPFFNDTAANLIGLLTLTYVPNYFDILPMYIVILLMLPFVVLARRAGPAVAFAFIVGVWLIAQFGVLALPAEPWSPREWFFNPFGWQLIFFTGFAFASRWLPVPPASRSLIGLAIVFLVLVIPLSNYMLWQQYPFLKSIVGALRPITHKTDFGLLRYVHFLALAYLACIVAGPGGRNLLAGGPASLVVRIIHKVGQQTLAAFVTGMFLAQIARVPLNVFDRSTASIVFVNLTGIASLIVVAYVVSWLKKERQPTSRPAKAPDAGQDTAAP